MNLRTNFIYRSFGRLKSATTPYKIWTTNRSLDQHPAASGWGKEGRGERSADCTAPVGAGALEGLG